jgi:hypothetical protein
MFHVERAKDSGLKAQASRLKAQGFKASRLQGFKAQGLRVKAQGSWLRLRFKARGSGLGLEGSNAQAKRLTASVGA